MKIFNVYFCIFLSFMFSKLKNALWFIVSFSCDVLYLDIHFMKFVLRWYFEIRFFHIFHKDGLQLYDIEDTCLFFSLSILGRTEVWGLYYWISLSIHVILNLFLFQHLYFTFLSLLSKYFSFESRSLLPLLKVTLVAIIYLFFHLSMTFNLIDLLFWNIFLLVVWFICLTQIFLFFQIICLYLCFTF